MSLHSSLKIDRASVTARSVQTRIERIKELMKKGLWKEETAVTGLPKTKIIRVKVKKKVKVEEGEVAGAPNAAEGTTASAKGGSASGGKPSEEAKAVAKPAAKK